MAAWLWVANADLWKDEDNVSAYEALRNYLERRDVSWSTPRFQPAITAGDEAYIWLSGAGLVAIGKVEEKPSKPKIPDKPRGWDERKATSPWKTRISLREVFFDKPLHVAGLQTFDGKNTVYRIVNEDYDRIKVHLKKHLGRM